jgi:YD repeat-containing protein
MMKPKLVFWMFFLTATMQLCLAQSTARGYSETQQLEELKTFDVQGHLTFRKWCLTDTHFEMHAWELDAKGKPTMEWEVLWRTDVVFVKELRYFQDRIESWEPMQESRLSADPKFAEAIQQFKRDGLPNTSTELLGYPAIRKILDGPMYCSELNELNAQGLPLTTTYFDVSGEIMGEEISEYDAQGRCTSFIEEFKEPEAERLVTKLKYNAQGKVSQFVEVEDGDEIDTMMVAIYSYQDTLLTERLDRLYGFEGKNWTKTTLTYDQKHRLIRDEITDSKVKGPVSYKTFSYDSRGRIAKEEWFRRDDNVLQKVWSVNWIYE